MIRTGAPNGYTLCLRLWPSAPVLLACALLSCQLSAAERRHDLAATGMPTGRLLAVAGAMLGSDLRGEPAASLEMGTGAAVLELAGASDQGLLQALAQALDCWYVADRSGGWLLTRNAHLPLGPELRIETYSSRPEADPGREALVRQLMAPWLGPGAGLAHHPPLGRWVASLDDEGHARLAELLTLLERPQPRIPPLVPGAHAAPQEGRLTRPIKADSWIDLARLLARNGLSVAIGPQLASHSQPIRLQPGAWRELPAQFAAQGVDAAWQQDVLCLGERPQDRLHPALRRHLWLIPVPHLAADSEAGRQLVAELQTQVQPNWWQQSGAALGWLPEARALLAAADPASGAALLAELRRRDRAARPSR